MSTNITCLRLASIRLSPALSLDEVRASCRCPACETVSTRPHQDAVRTAVRDAVLENDRRLWRVQMDVILQQRDEAIAAATKMRAAVVETRAKLTAVLGQTN